MCSRRQRRTSIGVLLALLLMAACSVYGFPNDPPLMVLFYAEDCPDCLEMEAFLEGLTFGHPESVLARHEVSSAESIRLLRSLSRAYGIDVPTTVPVLFIADEAFIGYEGRAQEITMMKPISDCLMDPVVYGCESPIAKLPRTQLRTDLPRLLLLLALFAAAAWWQVR